MVTRYGPVTIDDSDRTVLHGPHVICDDPLER